MTSPAARESPEVGAVRSAVRRTLAGLPPCALVLVACSGGADSLALAAAAAVEARRAGLRAGAVTVDHGLQPGSWERAEQVAATLRGLGLEPVEVAAVAVGRAGGPEAAARTARYGALEDVAERLGAAVVLLGHTRDDQAETVLLGLGRGSGARALAGMPAARGRFRRPLLGLPRATTRAACAAAGLQPWADPHNDDPAFARVRVRTDALPALERSVGPGAAAALARSARLLRDDADALDAWAGRVAAGAAHPDGGLAVPALAGLPAAVRRRVLRTEAVRAGVPAGALTAEHLEAVDALVSAWRGQGAVALPGGIRAARACGRLCLAPAGSSGAVPGPEPTREPTSVDQSDLGADLEKVLISAEEIHDRITELAAQIDRDYAGRDLLLVGVLKGAVMVMADLARALHSGVDMDWMAVTSYGSGTKSSGVVRILKDLDRDITGRDVLVVEDIIDSGLTLSWLLRNLASRGAASVEVCALLRKPEAAQVAVDVRYVGFDIPNEFVVGYGLDYAERYRNLPFVGTLKPAVYSG